MADFFNQQNRSVVIRTITQEQQAIIDEQRAVNKRLKELKKQQDELNKILKDYKNNVSTAVQNAGKKSIKRGGRRDRAQKRRTKHKRRLSQ